MIAATAFIHPSIMLFGKRVALSGSGFRFGNGVVNQIMCHTYCIFPWHAFSVTLASNLSFFRVFSLIFAQYEVFLPQLLLL